MGIYPFFLLLFYVHVVQVYLLVSVRIVYKQQSQILVGIIIHEIAHALAHVFPVIRNVLFSENNYHSQLISLFVTSLPFE